MSAHRPIPKQIPYWPEVKVCEADGEAWPCRASRALADCPKCGLEDVAIEVLEGRVRRVTMTKVHIKPNSPTATVCYAILKTEEHRDRTA